MWTKLNLEDPEDQGWYCEGGECPKPETEPSATWADIPYEEVKYGKPAYLCDVCYQRMSATKERSSMALLITRKRGEAVELQTSDGAILIFIQKVDMGNVSLGIEAPASVHIIRDNARKKE